jgi:hypothetical protein
MRSPVGPETAERAQTETVGLILVIGLVITGSLLVVALGAIAVGDTEEQLTDERAEKALTQFDSKAALVALGESGSYEASFGTGANDRGNLAVDEDRGWMNVTITNRSTDDTETVMNITLGAVVYEGEDSELAYQGGGVWRRDPEGGQMLSPPEFHYRGETLTLPAVRVSGDAVLNDEVTIERESTTRRYPDAAADQFNPLTNSVVNITVGSDFYRGWGQYFVERTEGDVILDETNETARLTLASPIGDVTAESIVAGQTSGGTLTFQGSPKHPCHSGGSTEEPYADSYNSSLGRYCDQYDPDEVNSAGAIRFGQDIRTESAAGGVQGDLVSGRDVKLHSNTPINGNISYTGDCEVTQGGASNCSEVQAEDFYSVTEREGVQPTPRIDFAIENTVDSIHQSGTEVDIGEGPTETSSLGAGEYYTDSLTLSNDEEVTFDTSSGDITLVVNNSIELIDDANLTVTGENDANIYVDGAGPTADELLVRNSDVFAPNNTASKLTVLGRGNFTATIEGGAFTGVLYAPIGLDGTGSIDVFGGGHIFGAVVTGDLTVGGTGGAGGGAGATIHYDERLQNQRVVPPDRSIIRVTFMHITENNISVSG